MSKLLCGFACLVFGLVVAGCEPPPSAETVTTIRADGSFDRKITLSSPSETQDKTRAARIHTISKTFGFPGGRGKFVWAHPHKNHALSMVFQHHYARGADVVHDVSIKSRKGVVLVVNEANVRPLGGGKWVYTERFHWIGRPISDKDFLNPGVRMLAKQALGANARSADIDELSIRFVKSLLWMLAGPGDAKTRRLVSKIKDPNDAILTAIAASMNAQTNDKAAREATDRLVKLMRAQELADRKSTDKARKKEPPDEAPIYKLDATNASVDIRARVPGAIVSTDGDRTKGGTVEWAFGSEAVVVHDVVLRVEYRP